MLSDGSRGPGGVRSQLAALPMHLLVRLPFVAAPPLIAMPFPGGAAPGQISVIDLPTWATVYSVAVWPLVWAIAEQLFYLGYLLRRRILTTTIIHWLADAPTALLPMVLVAAA